MCAQEIEDRKERALYYLSRTLVGAELNYSPIEKICLALVFAIQKLRHYMQAHTIHVVSKADPIKYILSRPVLSGRLAKWAMLLKQYDLVFVPQKAVKEWEISDDLPGEEIFYVEVLPSWQMYFDGAARKDGARAGVVFALQLLNQLDDIHVGHVPRSANKLADVLANLTATLALGAEESMQVPVCNRWVVTLLEGEENVDTTNMICVYTVNEDDWRQPIIDFLDHQKLPDDPRHNVEIRRRAQKFIHYKGTLYRRSFLGQWLRCLSKDEATEAMHEAHSGICGAHQYGPKLHDRVKIMGYYWPTMVQDSWGLDVVGPLTPKASNGHEYILATDYFSIWAEAITLREVKKENVVDFIRTQIIYRYGYKSSMYNASANGLAQAFNKTCNLLKKVVEKSKRDWHERIGEALWAYRTTYKTPTQATPYALVYGVEAVLPLEL
ncbi:uncharacterized protein LOC141628066 [Silene latifolia]|uniref:uncharacterized protein LOC141628066 n=1 Tax=Silene latifolia TaxID=37657 RepID=UPI003D7822EF